MSIDKLLEDMANELCGEDGVIAAVTIAIDRGGILRCKATVNNPAPVYVQRFIERLSNILDDTKNSANKLPI